MGMILSHGYLCKAANGKGFQDEAMRREQGIPGSTAIDNRWKDRKYFKHDEYYFYL